MRLAAVCVLLVACGGKISGDDTILQDASTKDATNGGGGGGDAGTNGVDASVPTCGGGGDTATSISDAGCSVSSGYTCDDTTYQIDCTCPQATCTCSAQGPNTASSTIVSAPSICPTCGLTVSDYTTICGFPTH